MFDWTRFEGINRHGRTDTADLTEKLKGLDGWAQAGNAIRKEFMFQDFPEAVLFVSALVPGAEDTDHHPDIEIHYKRVVLTYSDALRRRRHRQGHRRRRHGRRRRREPPAPRGIRGRLMKLKKLYQSREVAQLTGLTARQLQWWAQRKLFRPRSPRTRPKRAASPSAATRRSNCSS